MVTGTDDPESLVGMAKLAAGMEDCDHPVSRIPVRLAAGGWEAWQPPKGHPAHEAFARLRARETAAAYAHQGHVLRRQPGVEGFVAGCMPGVEDSGFVGTLALWTKDSDPLLPKADWIMFAVLSDDRSKMSVVPPLPWETAQAIVGHLLEPTAHSPVRYRTKGFPSDDEILRLDRIATECRYPIRRGSQGEAKEETP
jgi:hypothetical protein